MKYQKRNEVGEMKTIYIYDVKSGELMGTYKNYAIQVVDMINAMSIDGVTQCVIV
jgi:hypothetical protein